jgi:hypothetical protein
MRRTVLAKIITAISAIAFAHGALAESGLSSIQSRISKTKPLKDAIYHRQISAKTPLEFASLPKEKPAVEIDNSNMDEPKANVLIPLGRQTGVPKTNFSLPKSGEIPLPPLSTGEDEEEILQEPEGTDLEDTSPDEAILDGDNETSPDELTVIPDETDKPNATGLHTESPEMTREPTLFPFTDPPTSPLEGNQACEAAVMINVGDTIVGTTVDAPEVPLLDCELVGFDVAPTRFYTLAGTGDGMILSFTASAWMLVYVYSGNDCDLLTCVTGGAQFSLLEDDGVTQSSRATLSWATMVNVTYYIATLPSFSDPGAFEFTVAASRVIPENGECAGAVSIENGVPVQGATTFGFISSDDLCTM